VASRPSRQKQIPSSKMIKITLLIILSSILPMLAVNYDLTEVNSKVTEIEESEVMNVEDSPINGLSQLASYSSLKIICEAKWSNILDDFTQIATNDTRRTIISLGFDQMTAASFVQVIEKAATMFDNNNLSKEDVMKILFPGERLGHFVVDNYSHARIIIVLNKVKAKLPNGKEKDKINNIQSGSSKVLIDQFREDHEGLAEEGSPPVILGP
jgi:hypothetical protein